MAVVDIKSNTDLIEYLQELEKSTVRFFDSNERSVKGLPSNVLNLRADLEFNERMCSLIGKRFKYFKGIVEGNGHTISVSSRKAVSLFSSVYYSVIKNLQINNQEGSRGLLLADDISHSTFLNVKLTGIVAVEESMGGFTKTIQNVTFENCSVKLKTKTVVSDYTMEESDTERTHFGAYVGVDLGSSKFINCTVSGDITSEVKVGGFCGHSKGSTFENCSILDLALNGEREVGLFAGRGSRGVNIVDCNISNSKVSGKFYTGFLIGKTNGSITVDKLLTDGVFINPMQVSSYAGGIAGTAKEITLTNSKLAGGIVSNFIVAGVCPNVEKAEVHNNVFDMTLTASGYKAMMTHVYPLVRAEFLTSDEKEITFNESSNRANINIIDLGSQGYVNPFKESIL